jgi:tetratricopeptide (TPR) repeat protein
MFPAISCPDRRNGQGNRSLGNGMRESQTIDLLKAGDSHRKMAHSEQDPQRKQQILDEALQSYQMALATSPDCWEAHYGCGIVFRRCGELEEAVECFEAALDIEPSGRKGVVWSICGSTLGALGDFPRARERLERAIEIDPESKKFRKELKRLAAGEAGVSFTGGEKQQQGHGEEGDERGESRIDGDGDGDGDSNGEVSASPQKAAAASPPKPKSQLDIMREELADLDAEIKEQYKGINAARNGKRRRATAKKSTYFEPDYDVDYKHGQQTLEFSKPWVEKYAVKNSDSNSNAEPGGLGALATASLKKMTEITISKDKGSDDATDNLGCILPALTDLSSVFRALEVLDLSGNRMNMSGVNSLSEFLEHRACHVATLKCERANLSDKLGARLLRTIRENNSLRALYLRHNCLKHRSFSALGAGLSHNSGLREAILGSNNLYGVGLEALSQGLAENKGLRRLDLSWNLLGRQEDHGDADTKAPERALKTLGMALCVNKSLVFLSMNNCSLPAGLCMAFGKGLLYNQTLYGLGFQGNKGTTDSKGYVCTDLVAEKVLGLEPEPERGSAAAHAGESWDTHRWSEHQFVFTSGSSGEVDPEEGKLYLHVMFDDWKPDEMQISYGDGSFQTQYLGSAPELVANFLLHRMVPPGRVWYFYSQGWRVLCARDQPMAVHPKLHVNRNFVDIAPRSGRLDASILRVAPRTEPWDDMEEDDLKVLVTSKPEWDLRRSLFTARERVGGAYYDEDMVTEALTNDLSLTKVVSMKVVASEEELSDLQEALEKVYGDLVALFRWYAARDDLSDPFTISWEECRDFARDAGMIDRNLTEGTMKKEFIVTNVELDTAADNDDNSLVRFEFIELVSRIANRKYVASGYAESLPAAVLLMHEEIIEPYMDEMGVHSADEFRKTCLYTEAMCTVFDKYNGKLERMFEDHTSAENNGVPVMLLNDLMEMLRDAGLVAAPPLFEERMLSPNRVRKIFLTSMLIVNNEQTTEKFKQLAYVDFLEALARIAQQQYLDEMMRSMDRQRGKKKDHREVHTNNLLPTVEGSLGRLVSGLIHELYAEQGHGYMILKRQKKKSRREKLKAKAATAAMLAAGPKIHVPAIPGLPPTVLGYTSEVQVPRMLGRRGGQLTMDGPSSGVEFMAEDDGADD